MNQTLLSQWLCMQSLNVFADVCVSEPSTTNDGEECHRRPLTVSKSAVVSSELPLAGMVMQSFTQFIQTIVLLLTG